MNQLEKTKLLYICGFFLCAFFFGGISSFFADNDTPSTILRNLYYLLLAAAYCFSWSFFDPDNENVIASFINAKILLYVNCCFAFFWILIEFCYSESNGIRFMECVVWMSLISLAAFMVKHIREGRIDQCRHTTFGKAYETWFKFFILSVVITLFFAMFAVIIDGPWMAATIFLSNFAFIAAALYFQIIIFKDMQQNYSSDLSDHTESEQSEIL